MIFINKKRHNNQIKFILLKLYQNDLYYCGIKIDNKTSDLMHSAMFSNDFDWRHDNDYLFRQIYDIVSIKYQEIMNNSNE